MEVSRSFLVNERSARSLGIERGSVGISAPCVMDRVSVRPITDQERIEAKITGTERRVFALGSWAETQADIAARKGTPAKATPVKPTPRKGKARKAAATLAPTATDKRREKMSLDDYYREQKACGVRS